jgi:asparagine synthetase B (glutamine-hydrolysing)
VIHTNWSQACSDIEILSAPEEDVLLRVKIPSTTADQIYYRISSDSIDIADDLRKLIRPTDTLDERAIYSLLQFGAAIPPLSPWKSICRAVPGRITTFLDHPARVVEADFLTEKAWDMESYPLSLDQQIVIVLDTLDRSILAAREKHRLIILFSGGVDSGLLAARAAALGLKDTLLVNYCFGSDDAESLLAEQMAKHIGLGFQRIQDVDSGTDVEDVLMHAGSDYRTPFCDHAAVPTSKLVRSVICSFGPEFAVLDGTGADGAFGLFGRSRQWQKLHSIPGGLLRVGSLGYRLLRSWRKDSKVEQRLKLLRRASQHRFPLSAVAQNPLAGIAYHAPAHISHEVESLGISWLHSISPRDPQLQLAALDLSLVCSGIFAQKSKSLFAASALDIAYPYLSPQMVRLALSSAYWQGAELEAKWLLKAALARHVPSEMVYRPKSGFIAPMNEKFNSPAFLAAFDKLLADRSQLGPFLNKDFLQSIRGKLTTKNILPPQTANLVWAVVFVNEWLEQVVGSATKRCANQSL